MAIQPIQMSITAIQPIQSAIVPITPIVSSASGAVNEIAPTNFKELLLKAMNDFNASQAQSADQVTKLATGEAKNIHDVMISMEQAGLALRYAIQIRNKLLDAYTEIIRMQV